MKHSESYVKENKEKYGKRYYIHAPHIYIYI